MQSFTGIMIIMLGYLLALGFGVIGIIGLKKVEKEFSKSNCDVSEMERRKRLPYLICTLIGYFLPVITSIILILVLLNMV
ncbi:hypothetical protein [Clostridium algidicarnis]|uniref:hypothetical protein n=1 Tax=Clostridium algidicarnis TaxID=37659 RepID=UPI001C0E6A10|nr:hypothetical protein [Clostridium algidicarnis]MBU3227788.1 hypothetical protein [Clostridium algidicarnis]MBU3251539.1 hypothetical protein [Clostridium algidicarnis]